MAKASGRYGNGGAKGGARGGGSAGAIGGGRKAAMKTTISRQSSPSSIQLGGGGKVQR